MTTAMFLCQILVGRSVPALCFRLIRLAEEVPSQHQRPERKQGVNPWSQINLVPPEITPDSRMTNTPLCSSGPIITDSHGEEKQGRRRQTRDGTLAVTRATVALEKQDNQLATS